MSLTPISRFTVEPGVIDLIEAAIQKRDDEGFDCTLSGGDLSHMAEQKRFLQEQGFEVGQSDVYPTLKAKDFPRALQLIFEQKVTGWWNLETSFVEYQVCTPEQFREALHTHLITRQAAEQ